MQHAGHAEGKLLISGHSHISHGYAFASRGNFANVVHHSLTNYAVQLPVVSADDIYIYCIGCVNSLVRASVLSRMRCLLGGAHLQGAS